jgi:hypothetical protein
MVEYNTRAKSMSKRQVLQRISDFIFLGRTEIIHNNLKGEAYVKV